MHWRKKKWHEFCDQPQLFFLRVSDDWNDKIARKIIETQEVNKLINEWWIKELISVEEMGRDVVLIASLLATRQTRKGLIEREMAKVWRRKYT